MAQRKELPSRDGLETLLISDEGVGMPGVGTSVKGFQAYAVSSRSESVSNFVRLVTAIAETFPIPQTRAKIPNNNPIKMII